MTKPIRVELPTIYGMKSVNAYLFLEPEPVLIDCGEKTIASWDALQSALSRYNLSVKDLKKLIITHAHVDHIGMAGKIVEESDVEVWVNDYCYDWAINSLEMWRRRMEMLESHILSELAPNGQRDVFKAMLLSFMDKVMNSWDVIPAERIKCFSIDGVLNFGGADWQVIYAPGHTNTQTCFYQKEKKWLISADMLLKITPTPVIESVLNDSSKREKGLPIMLQSFQKIAALDIGIVYPGHYEPFNNHRELIKSQLQRIHIRKEQTFELIKKGKHRFFELFDVLYANRMDMPAMLMLKGYLDLLLDENKIDARIENGFTAYHFV